MKRAVILLAMITLPLLSFSQSKLPNVYLKNLKGKTINVGSFNKSNKITIVSFWATWCGPCVKELNAIKKEYPKWQKELGVQLVAVSIDDARTKNRVRALVKGKGWKYNVLLDSNQELKRNMNIANVPYTVVLKNGEIVYKHSSYTPGFEKELYKKLKALKN